MNDLLINELNLNNNYDMIWFIWYLWFKEVAVDYKWFGSPEKVSLPPVGLTSIVILVDKHLSGFFPDKQHHWETKAGNTKDEELEGSTTEDVVDSGNVEQEDEQNCFHEHTSEHVFVEAGIDEGNLK